MTVVMYLDCKTVVFRRFRNARSAVSAILACEAPEPHTPYGNGRVRRLSPFSLAVFTFASDRFRSNIDRRPHSQKIRLFCSLSCIMHNTTVGDVKELMHDTWEDEARK